LWLDVAGFGDDDRDQTKRYTLPRSRGKAERGTMTDVFDRESNELRER